MSLILRHCQKCNFTDTPHRHLCPECGQEMEIFEADGRGRVLSFTIVHTPPEGFPVPLYLALVEVKSGFRILCRASHKSCLKIGRSVLVYDSERTYVCEPYTLYFRLKKWIKNQLKRHKKIQSVAIFF